VNQFKNSSPVNRPQPDKEEPAKKRSWYKWLLQVSLLLAIFLGLHFYQTRAVVRGPAPDFGGNLLDGTAVSLREFRGRPLLLQFWATWCPVCGLEQGTVQSISRDMAVLSVALDDRPAGDMQRWMEKKGLSYAVVSDPAGVISTLFGVQGVPTSVIIDPRGEIRFVAVGYTTELGLRLRLWWAGL
jgi:peroxiredoxin